MSSAFTGPTAGWTPGPFVFIDAAPRAVYLLPDAGAEAERDFLSLLVAPEPTVGGIFEFNLPPLICEIEAASQAGVAGCLFLDYRQQTTPGEKAAIGAAAARIANWGFVVGTSPEHRQINHQKCMLTAPGDGGEPWIVGGSTNWTAAAFQEVNEMWIERSGAFAVRWAAQFREDVAWALTNEPQYQIQQAVLAPDWLTHFLDPLLARFGYVAGVRN